MIEKMSVAMIQQQVSGACIVKPPAEDDEDHRERPSDAEST